MQQLQELKDELAESQKRAASQEDYRRDEAEDLRILQDAQDATIAKLRNELEQERRHVELLKEQLQEKDETLLLLEREKKQALSSPPSVPSSPSTLIISGGSPVGSGSGLTIVLATVPAASTPPKSKPSPPLPPRPTTPSQ